MSNASPKPKAPREKTTHKTYSGGDVRTVKKTIPKPKHWSFISPAEGRKGKRKIKKIKTKTAFWDASTLLQRIAEGQAGIGKLVVTWPDLGRALTFRDLLQLMQSLVLHAYNRGEEIEVNFTEDGWLIEIVDIPFAIQLSLLSELPLDWTHNQ